jgi:hypothetical protein
MIWTAVGKDQFQVGEVTIKPEPKDRKEKEDFVFHQRMRRN